ncbi:MAG: ABC transporter ATP-binding protein [Anaerolineae bacterium]|nr:ABC transporter ATP-binding protein [Anaerolineae bacterium]
MAKQKQASLITVRDLRRTFKLGNTLVRAVDGLDLDVIDGEFLCLMGPSGSGKTTLLNMIGGLDRPTDGQIRVNGQTITTLDENALAVYRRQQVGFVFQSFNLIATMTALDNVKFPMIFAGISEAERDERARDLLEQVGLGHRLHHKPTELSGGEQQRVSLARSMVNRPRILLGDEPTGNLDSRTGIEILEIFQRLNNQGHTIIVVTHDPRVSNYATRTVHMLDGQIVADNAAPI